MIEYSIDLVLGGGAVSWSHSSDVKETLVSSGHVMSSMLRELSSLEYSPWSAHTLDAFF